MQPKDLEYIIAISKCGTLTRAAETLFVSQPTLTKALQNAEQQYGVPLFERIGKKYVPTYAGLQFLRQAENVLDSCRNLDIEMANITKREVDRIRVGFPVMRVANILPQVLPRFRAEHPRIELQISAGASDQLARQLLAGELDLTFFLRPLREMGLTMTTLCKEEYLLAVPPDHPVSAMAETVPSSRYKQVDIHHLKGERFALQVPGQRSRQQADLIFERAGFYPEDYLVLENIGACLGLVAAGYCCSFVSESLRNIRLTKGKQPDLYSIGPERYISDFVVAHRKNYKISKAGNTFITLVREAMVES